MPFSRKVRIITYLLLSVFTVGTLGYHYLEGWSFLDSLYTTIVTLATVGYGDYSPVSPEGRIFTIFLIVFGVGAMAYSITVMMDYFVEDRLRKLLGRGGVERRIQKLENHHIICGCGRIGLPICRELVQEKTEFVVIEKDEDVIRKIEDEGFMCIKGSATEDKILLAAGIRKAKGIVCVLPTDAENLYVILTAKELNPNIFVLSRSEDEASERRLIRAGADRIMSPYKEGGMKMALAILRPDMLDFIELTTRRQSLELRMEELTVCEHSVIIGKSLEESGIRRDFGLIVVAVKKESEKMIFNPDAGYGIAAGDKLIALGEDADILRFAKVCSG